ncbi:hypothetical protein HG536_0E02780 [Torulaspora globosa]|uniref:Protein phosphatase n=1 Tax=Torulaspora globosa TaxID=48254 RepID=A0A7G3ZIN1_9SACH|nr:uncharacterized protein HG536_0E02780 [Torulaspora globosa]QLL33367.1 hypothetical protein HG536_0E02780 [Torulaspora globosa]
MFVSAGLRGGAGRGASAAIWHSMFLFVVVPVVLMAVVGYVLIPTGAIDAGGVSNQFFRVSKRCFFSGNGGRYYNGDAASGGSPTNFSYKMAVAYQPKDREDGVYRRLKTAVESPTGEDNYFMAVNAPGDAYAGVADGVGGWAEHGYDSSAISRELCLAMNEFSSVAGSQKDGGVSPKQLIEMGYRRIRDEQTVKVGGTTAIAAHFKPNGSMEVANLGDSWCGVFRNAKLVFKTEFQTVGFNAPYQLAIIPEEMLKEARRKGGSFIQNSPSDADEYNFQLAKGDVVVLATDGVTDNISYEDIQLFLRDNEQKISSDLLAVSQDFVSKVAKLSKDPNYPSVFAQEISKLTGKDYRGGKEDDITVVMVRVE